MGRVINQKDIKNHTIERFVFNTIESEEVSEKNIFQYEEPIESEKIKEEQEKEEVKHEEVIEKNNKQNLELLTKIENLTNKVVSLEMELEEQKKNYEKKLKKVEEEAFQKGIKEAKDSYGEEIEELKIQYISSITSIQEIGLEVKNSLKRLEEELIETSIIIAKKVLLVELEKKSSKVAYSIATHLLQEIKDDLEIVLLLNPVDYQEINRSDFNENIKLVPDKNIEKGGVVITSPKKNIDGTIKTRLKKTLQLIKEL